jgi:RND family efflux transporter MFP subunit
MDLRLLGAVAAGIVLSLSVATHGKNDEREWKPSGEAQRAVSVSATPAETSVTPTSQQPAVKIEAVVVTPYRVANVGGQVGGEIDMFHFEEGDPVSEGQIVVELDPRRYKLALQRAEEKYMGLQAILRRADEEAQIKQQLYELDSTSLQEVIRTKADAEVAGHRVKEAKAELDLAKMDLEGTKIKAPFTGHIAIRHKQPDEPVERLEKIFGIVDSSRVHVVANVPENLLSQFGKGKEFIFLYGKDKKFTGTVDRIGKLIDPKSKTKKVYLLLDNSKGELEVGMTGSLQMVN